MKWTDSIIDRLVEWRARNNTYRRIAERLPISVTTTQVQYRCKRDDIKKRIKDRKAEIEQRKIADQDAWADHFFYEANFSRESMKKLICLAAQYDKQQTIRIIGDIARSIGSDERTFRAADGVQRMMLNWVEEILLWKDDEW